MENHTAVESITFGLDDGAVEPRRYDEIQIL